MSKSEIVMRDDGCLSSILLILLIIVLFVISILRYCYYHYQEQIIFLMIIGVTILLLFIKISPFLDKLFLNNKREEKDIKPITKSHKIENIDKYPKICYGFENELDEKIFSFNQRNIKIIDNINGSCIMWIIMYPGTLFRVLVFPIGSTMSIIISIVFLLFYIYILIIPFFITKISNFILNKPQNVKLKDNPKLKVTQYKLNFWDIFAFLFFNSPLYFDILVNLPND